MDLYCPTCGNKLFDAGDMYRCEMMDQCPIDFKFYKKTAGYELTQTDMVAICGGVPTEEHDFISKAGKPFKAGLIWSDEERRVIFKFRKTSEVLEGVLCPEHGVELRMAEKRYYCPTKIDEGLWCQVGAWRTYGSHKLAPEELGELVSGIPVGPWEMQKKDGSGTYYVMAEFDFDESKVVTSYVEVGATDKVSKNGNHSEPF